MLKGVPVNQTHWHGVPDLPDCVHRDGVMEKAKEEVVGGEWYACAHSRQVVYERLRDRSDTSESFFRSP